MDNLDKIYCPFCGGNLKPVRELDAKNLIIACDCSRFPVVEGIPILVEEAIHGTIYSKSALLNALEKGNKQEALVLAMSRGVADTKFTSLLKKLPCGLKIYERLKSRKQRHQDDEIKLYLEACKISLKFKDFVNFYFCSTGKKRPGLFNYYYYKYGEPRFFAAKSILPLYDDICGQPILDIGCGTGQLTRELAMATSYDSPIYALDLSYFCLYAAKKFVYPDATYIVCDVDQGLPFRPDYFSGVFCSNTLHFIRNKNSFFSELSRVTDEQPVMAFTSVRHIKQVHSTWSHSVSVDRYRALVGQENCTVFADDQLIDRYFNIGEYSNYSSSCYDDIEKYGLITFVTGDTRNLFKEKLSINREERSEKLKLNPLYADSKVNKNTIVRMAPSDSYEAENYKMRDYFPREIEVSDNFFKHLRDQNMSEELVELLHRGVVVDLPDRY